MKVVVAFVVLLAGALALPKTVPNHAMFEAAVKEAVRTNDARIVDGIIVNVINNIIQRIQDEGLDPFYREGDQASYAVVEDFIVDASFSELLVEGLSNIAINSINFSILTLRMTFDFSLPRIEASLAEAVAGVHVGDYGFYGAELGGRFAIIQPRITGTARVGIVPSITIREITVTVSLQNLDDNVLIYRPDCRPFFVNNFSFDMDLYFHGIVSALRVKVLNADFSDAINELINGRLLDILHSNSATINEWVNRIVVFIIDLLL